MAEWVTRMEQGPHGSRKTDILSLEPKDSILGGLSMFWQKASEEMAAARAEESSDSLIISIRPNTGRIIASPGQSSQLQRNDKTVVWVKIPDIENRYFDLPDGNADPAGFEAAHGRLIARILEQLMQAARSEPAHAAITNLRRSQSVKVMVMEYDDAETAVELPV